MQMNWKKILFITGLLALSSCTDAYEQKGLCSYLGGCDSKKDPTEYTSPYSANKEVGLCSYLGGCMESGETGDSGIGPPKKDSSPGDGGGGE